jgi:5,10-methylenetetrahydromethanopterin reductase
MSGPRFGIGMRANSSPAECARLGRVAEDLGFDVISVFSDLGDPPPIPALLAIAAATSVVALGPACLNPYTMHPVEIASGMAQLDLASGGRAYLGLARGAWLKTIGVAQPKPVQSIREAASVVRLLLSGEASGFHGGVFRISPGFTLSSPVPRRPLPLLVGAWGRQTVTMAGEIADELKVGGSANPDIVPVMRERLEAGAARAGRAAQATGIALGAVTVVDPDGVAARRHARTAVARYFEVVADLDPSAGVPAGLLDAVRARLAKGDVAGAGETIPDDVLDRFCFAGTPEQVARQVHDVIAQGASRIEFGQPFGLDRDAGLHLLAERVMSEFR